MLRTYTIYLLDDQARPRFKPVLARTDADALREARKLLDAHPECKAIEVHFGEDILFRIGRS